MKGLIMKDLYVMRESWLVLALSMIVVSAGMSFLVSPWVATSIFAAILGSVAVSSIQTDRACNWQQLTATMPMRRNAFAASKFTLYALVSLFGVAAGALVGLIVRLAQGALNLEEAALHIFMSLCIALLPGSISIPCAIRLSPERATAMLMMSYVIASALFAGIVALNRFWLPVPFDMKLVSALAAALSAGAYGAAWWACVRRRGNAPS